MRRARTQWAIALMSRGVQLSSLASFDLPPTGPLHASASPLLPAWRGGGEEEEQEEEEEGERGRQGL